jgi:DNA-binding beta-propeller fold protein YncE
MAEDAANVANNYMEHAKMNSAVEDIEFQPDRTILTQLDNNKTLGTLSEKLTKTSVNLFQIKGNQSYNVKVKSDNDSCHIKSACCMEDGAIILADFSNNKLKRLHSHNYTVTDYCDLPAYPWQMCMINNTQVAVTVPSLMEINFISLEGKMKTTNKIKTDFTCYGLAFANNNLYISDGGTSVYIYTLSGRKLKQFSKDQSGHKLFTDIHSIAVSKDATRIYVADFYNGLIVLDNNGQVIKSFNDEQLEKASCCYLTEAGSVLVSGVVSNNVLQFTSVGELIGEVIKPDSRKENNNLVCCNQQMTKMYISRNGDDNIEVYDI